MSQNNIYDGPWDVADKSGIFEVIKKRNIQQLVHYTRRESIEKICLEGLLPVKDPKTGTDNGIKQVDPDRHDKRLNHISLSITYPNSYIIDEKKVTEGPLAYIMLNPELLKCNPALFFHANAALRKFRNVDFYDENWNSGNAFENLFYSDKPNRSYPRNLQAELQVLGPINPEWIIKIYFKESLNEQWLTELDKLIDRYRNIKFIALDSI